jgi:threonine dehydratase
MSTLENGGPVPHIICASAGNFGQAMAYAARKRGIEVTVYAAKIANPLKIERMKSLGAKVVLHSDDFDTAKLEAKRVAQNIGATMVEDGLAPEIAEGAGTIGLELLQLPEQLDALIVPLGNGALLTGIARVFKARSPHTKIIAVQATGAPAMVESWRSGKVIVHEKINTICDGIAVRIPILGAVEDMRGLVDDALLISDDATIHGMQLLHQHAGLLTEPSGAAGVAAILKHRELFKDQRIATIICGSNLTPEQMDRWLFPRQ